MRRTLTTLTLTLCAVIGLSACTAAPETSPTAAPSVSQSVDEAGDGGQSVADACALIQDTIAEAGTEFESIAAQDPAAVVESMQAAASTLADAAPNITNDEVAALVTPLQQMFEETARVLEAVAQGDVTKLGDLSDLGTQFQQTGERFQALCAQ